MKTDKCIIYKNWLLRMECDSFIMVVNKNTNEYRNIYKTYFEDPDRMRQMTLLLDKHKNYR